MKRRCFAIITNILVALSATFLAFGSQGLPIHPNHDSMSDVTGALETGNRLPLGTTLANPALEVLKASRELILYADGKVVRTYRVGIGPNPVGTKLREGDGRTPEGHYYVCAKNPKSNYYLSLGLSYPNETDAGRGLKAGLIDSGEYSQIVTAIRQAARPPWDTKLGGEIFIHGGGSGSDWTMGCVALENPDIEELYDIIPAGTPVTIKP
jgi:murein L,D-transpeptidase YafK